MTEQGILRRLQEAFQQRNLTLYLGAGVSAESGVPTWDVLVAAMYFSAVYAEQRELRRRPFPNYLRAVAEWYLKRLPEPLEIVAQKVRQHHRDQGAFLESLRQNLYPTLMDPETLRAVTISAKELRAGNRTLDAVASLAETQFGRRRGVRAVVTYNFDSLLEVALASLPHQPLWDGQEKREWAKLPVFHVHGYVPLDQTAGSRETELIFSEDQYHAAAQDAYSWANVVQLKYISGATGLMVGLSATDRNMRRLLDAVRKTPIQSQNFVLLQRPRWESPMAGELEEIHERAMKYKRQMAGSGVEPRDDRFPALEELLGRVEAFDLKQHERLLERLGVVVWWYDDHAEVPDFLARITGTDAPT